MRRRRFAGTIAVAAAGGFTLALAAHQHLDPAFEGGDILGLRRDDLAEIIAEPFEMGDFLFELFHGRYMTAPGGSVKGAGKRRLAPTRPIR